jgi:hypothetical protein|tara:strand:+ start:2987 stop:3271 length:285 start_codon:yes stop_codon:yes gene_type:complete
MANKTTDPATNMEPNIGNAPLGKKEITRHDSRICIHVHSIRKRLADTDGISAKAVLDGIVKAGLLKDDTTEFIKEITYSQEKGTPEETIISAYL